jgi:hypothetical protein
MEAWSRVEGAEGRLQQSLEAWLGWSQGGAGWPPDQALGAFPDQLGEVIVGTDPPSSALPHYEFEEQTDEARTVKAADPTALFLRSRWHETAARQLVPDSAGILDGFLAPWRLPVEESAVVVPEDMGDGWLFGGFVLTAQDVGFIADASTRGTAALDDWRARSPLAAALVPAIKDDKLIPELALDQAAMLSQQLEAELVKRAGQEEAIHRGFVQLARVGVIRAAMVVADASDQSRDAGILRLNALDRSSGPAADPVFYVSVAAWDTGNRNPLRAQDLLHGLVKRFPAVEISRYPLDAMHIRLSRNAAPATPVH